MQVMIYLDQFGPRHPDYELDFFKMIYLPRDKPNAGREYTITLVTTNSDIPSEMKRHMTPHERYALIQTEDFSDKVSEFSVEDIHRRAEEQKRIFDAEGEVPERPLNFKKFYTEEEIERYRAQGDISKTAYTNWEKAGKPLNDLESTPGHFMCQSYCEYRGFCYLRDGSPRPEADAVGLVR